MSPKPPNKKVEKIKADFDEAMLPQWYKRRQALRAIVAGLPKRNKEQ